MGHDLKALLDTHALLWTLTNHPKLSRAARAAVEDDAGELIVSAASMMEIFIKHRSGKVPEADPIVRAWDRLMAPPGYALFPISAAHARLAGSMDIAHKNPFDRLLIAQARIERVPLVCNEAAFDAFGIERIW